jgi:hypothetical protein
MRDSRARPPTRVFASSILRPVRMQTKRTSYSQSASETSKPTPEVVGLLPTRHVLSTHVTVEWAGLDSPILLARRMQSHSDSKHYTRSALVRILSIFAVFLFAMITIPAVALAQACEGGPAFTHHPFQVTGGAGFSTGKRAFSGGLGAGGAGAFAGAAIGTLSVDDFQASSLLLGAHVGYQIPTGSAATICPVGSVVRANGFDLGGGYSLSETDLAFGLAVGAPVVAGQVTVVPTGALSYANASGKLAYAGQSVSASKSYGLLDLGVGLLASPEIGLLPQVSIPLGLDGASATFSVSLTVNFGEKTH